MDTSLTIELASILIAAVLGVLGYLTDSKKNGRLTPWGIVAIIGVLLSNSLTFFSSVEKHNQEIEEKKITALKDSIKTDKILSASFIPFRVKYTIKMKPNPIKKCAPELSNESNFWIQKEILSKKILERERAKRLPSFRISQYPGIFDIPKDSAYLITPNYEGFEKFDFYNVLILTIKDEMKQTKFTGHLYSEAIKSRNGFGNRDSHGIYFRYYPFRNEFLVTFFAKTLTIDNNTGELKRLQDLENMTIWLSTSADLCVFSEFIESEFYFPPDFSIKKRLKFSDSGKVDEFLSNLDANGKIEL